MSELCLLNKEVSGFLPVLCGCVNLYLIGFCATFGFLGNTAGAASWEVPIFTVLLGSDWTSSLLGLRVSESKGLYYVERFRNQAPRSSQTLKAFSGNGGRVGIWKIKRYL